MKRILTFFCIILVCSSAYAYKKSEWKEFKEARVLCSQKYSAQACARAAYLYQELFFTLKPPAEMKKESKRRDFSYRLKKKLNHFFKTGCQLGDPVQCVSLYTNKNIIDFIDQYSDIVEGDIAAKYDSDLKSKNSAIRRKYLKEKADGYSFENAYYRNIKNTTISEIKKAKNKKVIRKKPSVNISIEQRKNMFRRKQTHMKLKQVEVSLKKRVTALKKRMWHSPDTRKKYLQLEKICKDNRWSSCVGYIPHCYNDKGVTRCPATKVTLSEYERKY